MTPSPLSTEELDRLRAIAAVLIPGLGASPPATDLPDLDELLSRAAAALGRELPALRDGIARVPAEVDWAAIVRLADEDPTAFDVIGAVVAGAYFMSPTVLRTIGYPTGPRSAAPFDLAADELASGILSPVQTRGSRVRMPQ